MLVTAGVILYLFPDDTERLFAWPMRPRPTALVMGAGYFVGAYFFARLAFATRWHRAGVPLPGVATFAALLAVVSVLHWNEFTFGHIAFYAWVIVYGVAPFVVAVIWWRNRATDSGRPDAADIRVPRQVRITLAVLGVMLLGGALVAFIRPDLMIASWPWSSVSEARGDGRLAGPARRRWADARDQRSGGVPGACRWRGPGSGRC